jgi:hypothetical protein
MPFYSLILVFVSAATPETDVPLVTVVPKESEEILANPGMGWETFGRSRLQDKNLPTWIPSTIYYTRWGWRDLEPRPGEIEYGWIDKALKDAHEAGQKVAFRVACCNPLPESDCTPSWLPQIGGRMIRADRYGNKPVLIPDMDDPAVLKRHLDFLRRIGKRYDGHPDLDHVDLGSVGWYGEWHQGGKRNCRLPTLENRMKIVDAYLADYKKTPLLMLINGGECPRYATPHGAGWRADCLGDFGGFSRSWNHMIHGYPVWLRNAGAENAWKTAPVAWESCWDMRKWVAEGWSLRSIFNYALAYHASYLNNKSAPLPDRANVRPEIERFLRRLGYRLVLKELKHPAAIQSGKPWTVSMKWQNTGSAPCYKPYRLAYRLDNGQGKVDVLAGKITVNRWLPGSIELGTDSFLRSPPDLPHGTVTDVSDTITLPANLPPGEYSLSIAVADGDPPKPVLRLGIQGRAKDGWYPLSRIEVGEGPR